MTSTICSRGVPIRRVQGAPIHLVVALGHPRPRAGARRCDCRGRDLPPTVRIGGEVEERTRESHRIPRRHHEAAFADDLGERPACAGDHRHPAGHRLDGYSAELLDPPRGRERRYCQHVDPLVERRQLVVLNWSEKVNAISDPQVPRLVLQPALHRTGARAVKHQAFFDGDSIDQHVHPLVRCKSTDVADLDGTGINSPLPGRRSEGIGIHAQRDDGGLPRKPLALDDPPGVAVADADAGRVPQGPSLEPTKGHWIALIEVLRRVERVWRPLPADPP